MQRRIKRLDRETKFIEEQVPKEEREDITTVTSLVTMQENATIKGTIPNMMNTTAIKTLEGMQIKGTIGSKERGRLPLIEMEMEIVNLSRGQGTPGMINKMLCTININFSLPYITFNFDYCFPPPMKIDIINDFFISSLHRQILKI